MFESAACDQLHLIDTPFVHGQAPIELKTVLQTALHAGVLQARKEIQALVRDRQQLIEEVRAEVAARHAARVAEPPALVLSFPARGSDPRLSPTNSGTTARTPPPDDASPRVLRFLRFNTARIRGPLW